MSKALLRRTEGFPDSRTVVPNVSWVGVGAVRYRLLDPCCKIKGKRRSRTESILLQTETSLSRLVSEGVILTLVIDSHTECLRDWVAGMERPLVPRDDPQLVL